ncbi:16S rRNA (guanine(527)-N(7))-methyltransferase RsmG [Tropicimonas sp. TH_r6]|uniref:16S rRNA (guanine(527)-N(7))-methyltransferase RsmG n=1 Tax=Tropicimonas sp. TH_r6 TaxID=3082085 RepID=UPI0029552631|nr:16S rRNA (guanine(527)-N(7))-methyltransferase RsmG [Tropicimonas sp. TH_r6]MDV7141275.1 16S rRNA (guanine(527)-N(7))-methyltransferase RsmG [Tropicimonas sp. TH_r6]
MLDGDGLEKVLGETVSRETVDMLETHLALLEKWNPAINLVSSGSLKDGWSRHTIDSAQVFVPGRNRAGLWVDFGSGGGFPGLVAAILATELAPDLRFVLVESDKRKSAFLLNAVNTLKLNVTILAERVEALPCQSAQVISARAVSELGQLLNYAEPHLAEDGICIFPKGERYEQEISRAEKHWRFKLAQRQSITDPKAVILVLGDIQRV